MQLFSQISQPQVRYLCVGLGRAWTRPEGVLGDPNLTRAFFGGPEADRAKFLGPETHFSSQNPYLAQRGTEVFPTN